MWTEQKLYNLLTEPSGALVEDMKRIKGDILVLGAGGKMGPTLCVLAKRALEKAGSSSRIIAVSRFSGAQERRFLKENGVDIIQADLLDAAQRAGLPQVENVIYMAGRKFETVNQEWETWAMNASLSGFIAEQYKESRIVVFSSGNVYPLCSVQAAGCSEEVPPQPIGEYAMSCLARERAFEFAANRYGTRVLIYRLSFAVDLRYGVLYDIANRVFTGQPVSVRNACFNCIWQGDANEIALRALHHASSPATTINVTGPEIISVKKTAQRFG